MFPKQYRMTSTYEFNKTRKLGRKVASDSFDIFYIPQNNKDAQSRIGIVATLRFSPKAPVRNRVKRIFRELMRANLDRIVSGYLVVIHPKRIALDKKYEELSVEFNKVLSEVSLT